MTRRAYTWLLLLILSGTGLVYLLGNQSVQLWDRDEPRYAQTSRQMLQSGDWVVPHFLDTVRTAKPVLIYWCQATAMALLGDNAFAARLPSAIAMVLTLALLYYAIARAAGAYRALWTIFIFGTSGLAIVSAKMSLTDSVLLLFTAVAQLCLCRLWRGGLRPATAIVLGVAIGLAGLTKGPVVLGVVLTTWLALWLIGRTTRRAEPGAFGANDFPVVAGVVLAMIFLVVFPWLYLIQVRSPGFVTGSIAHDVIARAQRGAEGHSAPPGFYLLLVWGTFFPWSLLLPAALVNGWQQRHKFATRFALAALIGPWVMFELVATKLPHYVLPCYPALAYLTADLLIRASRGAVKDLSTRGFRVGVIVWCVIVALLGCGGLAVLLVVRERPLQLIAAAAATAIVAILMAVMVARRFSAGRVLGAARVMGVGMLALVAVAYGWLLPQIGLLRMSRDAAQIIAAHGGYGARGYMIDYKEPSLAFYQGGGLREQSHDDYLTRSDPAAWPEWIVLTTKIWKKIPEPVRRHWQVVGTVRGLAYNEGGSRDIVILRRAPNSR